MRSYRNILASDNLKAKIQALSVVIGFTFLCGVSIIIYGCAEMLEMSDKCRVPDVRNKTVPEAQSALEQGGFELGDVLGDGPTVVRQSPNPWAEKFCGGRVDVWLSTSPASQQSSPSSQPASHPVQIPQTNTLPLRTYTIQHVSSGKCWHPEGGSPQPSNGTYVVLHDGCHEGRLMFRFLADGSIQHATSGKCLHPEGGSAYPGNNTRLVFHDGCVSDRGGGERLQFRRLHDGSIQHVPSGKCVHPFRGSAQPDNNTRLVLHDGCASNPGGGERLQFRIIVP